MGHIERNQTLRDIKPNHDRGRGLVKIVKTNLAGDEGFEPPITGPEPVALPLGQSPLAPLV